MANHSKKSDNFQEAMQDLGKHNLSELSKEELKNCKSKINCSFLLSLFLSEKLLIFAGVVICLQVDSALSTLNAFG